MFEKMKAKTSKDDRKKKKHDSAASNMKTMNFGKKKKGKMSSGSPSSQAIHAIGLGLVK